MAFDTPDYLKMGYFNNPKLTTFTDKEIVLETERDSMNFLLHKGSLIISGMWGTAIYGFAANFKWSSLKQFNKNNLGYLVEKCIASPYGKHWKETPMEGVGSYEEWEALETHCWLYGQFLGIQTVAKLMATKPQRIQLSRKKGWKMPANTVIVDRRNKQYGNPYKVGAKISEVDQDIVEWAGLEEELIATNIITQAIAVSLFKAYFDYECVTLGHFNVLQTKADLKGKNLACWCKIGTPCHADFLLEIANK